MKKFLVAILAVTLMASPALATNGGGKKKAKKKARTECKIDKSCDIKSCDPKDCDPKNCDPKNCDPKACDFKVGTKLEKGAPTTGCASN